MRNMQLGFFDTENRYERLTQLGDPLERLNGAINWEMFRGKLTAVCQKENYTKGGRPPIDVIIKFKASILRRLYNLSFDQIEYQINDRLTFMRFLGLGIGEKVLDSRTIWDFENTLAEAEVMEELFCMFDAMLEAEGLITHKGTIVDATFVDTPRQRNCRDENQKIKGGEIQSEILRKDGQSLIMRERFSAAMYNDNQVSPPAGKLLIQVRRDTQRYPEIEEIIRWAEHTSMFVFSNITTSPNSLSPYTISNEPLLPVMYEKISEEKQKRLLTFMHELGYEIDRIEEYQRENGSKMLHIYEKGIENPMTPFELSNGMFRVFCVLLYMLYCSTLADARCLIIDDMGEGLDYMRSTRLGKIMFNYCEENHIQLLATSNDSFLMDAVDLQYWNILQRKGGRVYSLNNKNSKELFERFVRTGLSNFDILSSNFIANNTKDE